MSSGSLALALGSLSSGSRGLACFDRGDDRGRGHAGRGRTCFDRDDDRGHAGRGRGGDRDHGCGHAHRGHVGSRSGPGH